MTVLAVRATPGVSGSLSAGRLAVVLAWALFLALQVVSAAWASQARGPGMLSAEPPDLAGRIVIAAISVLLMTTAMMLPLALPAADHVARNSLRARRRSAVVLFLAAYISVWAGLSTITLAVVATARTAGAIDAQTAPWLLLALVVIAAVWQASPAKQRILRGCQRPTPLPARGWRASAGSVRYGLVYAGRCLATCWAVMMVMLVAPANHVWWTFAVAGLLVVERFGPGMTRRPGLLAPVILAIGLPLAALSATPPDPAGLYVWLCPVPLG